MKKSLKTEKERDIMVKTKGEYLYTMRTIMLHFTDTQTTKKRSLTVKFLVCLHKLEW